MSLLTQKQINDIGEQYLAAASAAQAAFDALMDMGSSRVGLSAADRYLAAHDRLVGASNLAVKLLSQNLRART